MYIPAKNFETPQDQEIICPLTGESYVHMEGSLETIDSKYHDGALETLPRRFYQGAIIMPMGNGQARIITRRPYDY